jgi:cation:H+ antiporter
MAIDLLIIVATLAVLAVAADRFVISAAAVARLLGASPLFIGVVLIGVGTSLPDWLVSAFAAADGQDGIAVGNFVGSNTVNIGLALGVAAVIAPLVVSSAVLRREAALSIGAVLVLSLALIGGIDRVEGMLLLVALPIAFWIVRPADPPPGHRDGQEGSLALELGVSLVTLAATVGASRLLVDAAADVALELGISDAFIGLSLVAIGTSLPEIVVGIQSVRRGQTDLVVGNVLGSNLVNSLGVAGTAALLTPVAPLDSSGLAAPILLMAGFAVVGGGLLVTGRRLVRWEGLFLVAVYCATLPFFA